MFVLLMVQPSTLTRLTPSQDFPLGVVAHSDGDVVYHSTTDAILGPEWTDFSCP